MAQNTAIAGNLAIVQQAGEFFANTNINDFVIYTPNTTDQKIYIGVQNDTNPAPMIVGDNTVTLQMVDVEQDIHVSGKVNIMGAANFAQPVFITEITADEPVTVNGVSFSNTSLIADNITFSNEMFGNNITTSNIVIDNNLIAPYIYNSNVSTSNIFVNRKIRFSNKPFI